MGDEKVVLLSHEIDEQTPFYGKGTSVKLKQDKSIRKGDSCNTMHWSFYNHTGTHVDVPLHFLEKGASVTDLRPEEWIFSKVLLVEVTDTETPRLVKVEDLKGAKDCELLLIRTGYEKYRGSKSYLKDSLGLHPELADWLKTECPSIRAVGIDSISISNIKNRELGRMAHKSFLENNILLIEDMKLSPLGEAPDRVIIAPLLVKEADGAPCTVFGIYV
jgi:kynurenine formamidase